MVKQLNSGPVIQKEKETATKMIHLYCKKKHHQRQLCPKCQDLQDYALKRLSYCRFGKGKTACSNCKVHCYQRDYQNRIKTVMRYSGPWMLVYHPVYAVKHLLNK
ncbi:nitrous oxide-stimulated promoter family protein [Neobacillus dielmonensis]|uniref:nitrous oxide-stimulated promoter family protein n=1 Tax=Neobacillus dielmonensis TaxID=1347369 RepID=UPI0005A6D898|nr:nitrous oxide-stimulated promoter family protein [Neobacillus dielmonensis]